jgi:hypothetical protein
MDREGREILFSADVDTIHGRHYFHVAAQSANDAYDQLLKREEFVALSTVESVSIFDGPLEERRDGQMPLKVIAS